MVEKICDISKIFLIFAIERLTLKGTQILFDIKIGKNSAGKQIIIFQDNGPGMNKEQFDDYHIGAKPTKVKGKGIGFAGIGAKVYLAVDDSVQIWTETCC